MPNLTPPQRLSVSLDFEVAGFGFMLTLAPFWWHWPHVNGPVWFAGPFFVVVGRGDRITAEAEERARRERDGVVDAPPPGE